MNKKGLYLFKNIFPCVGSVFRIVQKQHDGLWSNLLRGCVCFCDMDFTSLLYVCICVQSFIYSNFVRNYDSLYSIQIKCFLTNQQSSCQQIFQQNPDNATPKKILMLFLLFLNKKLPWGKMLFVCFSLEPFSYQINKTWHVAQYLQKKNQNKTKHRPYEHSKIKKKEIKNAESAYNSQVAGIQKRTRKKWLTKIYKYNEVTTVKSLKKCHGNCLHVYHTVLTHNKRYAESSR